MNTLDEIRQKLRKNEVDAKSMTSSKRLNAKEKTRHKRLLKLLNILESGKDIANRELKVALTDDEWDEFNSRKKHIKERNNREMPKVLKAYMETLKKADFLYMRAMNTKTTKRSRRDAEGKAGAGRLEYKAEGLYEDALIKLEEMFDGRYKDIEGELTTWFDRDIDLAHGSLLGADPINIPRIRGSKSQHCLMKDHKLKENEFEQRRELKKNIVIQAIVTLLKDESEDNEKETSKGLTGSKRLRELLQSHDDNEI
jgi:hypothetical protein